MRGANGENGVDASGIGTAGTSLRRGSSPLEPGAAGTDSNGFGRSPDWYDARRSGIGSGAWAASGPEDSGSGVDPLPRSPERYVVAATERCGGSSVGVAGAPGTVTRPTTARPLAGTCGVPGGVGGVAAAAPPGSSPASPAGVDAATADGVADPE